MSDVVVKLHVESKEYENKLKNAAAKLLDFESSCRNAGTSIKSLDEKSLEYIQSLGKMATKATNTKGALGEMTKALTDMTAIYRRLSDDEKKGMFGQELSKQIKAIQERAASLRDTMDDVATVIKAKASDTGTFDQIAGGIQGMTTAFQVGQGAAKLFGIEIGDDVQVIAKLQSAMAVTSGLMQAQNLLQKESSMMMGVAAVQAKALAAAQALAGKETKIATVAQAAFNAVAKANPYVLLASAVAAAGVALLGFSKSAKTAAESQETMTDAMKEAQHMADVYSTTMQSSFSSLRTKYDELQRAWNSLKTDHERTEWIKQNQQAFHGLGLEVTTTKQAEDFFNGNTDAVVQSFVRRAQAAARVAQLTELYRKQIELLDKKSTTSAAISSDAQRSGRHANAGDAVPEGWRSSRYGRVNQAGQWVFTEEGAKLYSGSDTSTAQSIVAIDRQLAANAAEIEKVKRSIGSEAGVTFSQGTTMGGGRNRTGGGTHTDGNTGGHTTTTIKPEYIPLEGSIDAQMAKVQELQKAWHAVATEQERAQIKTLLDKETETLDQMQGKVKEVRDNYIPLVGSIDYVEQKISSLTSAWKAAADDDSRRRILDELNLQKAVLESMEGKGIEPGINSGKQEESKSEDKLAKLGENIGKFAGGMNNITSGLNNLGVNLPKEVNRAIDVISSVGQIIQGLSAVIELFSTSTQAANTIAVAANTVAVGALTTAVVTNTATNFIPFFSGGGIVPEFALGGIVSKMHLPKFEKGGMVSWKNAIHAASGYYVPEKHGPIVPGNSFSGDMMPALVNSGELILNRAQQGIIADQLSGTSSQPSMQYAVLRGEDLICAINNTSKRKGRGEIVTWK